MEKLHKIVNGVRIDLTEEEEIETRAEWARSDARMLERIQQRLEQDRFRESVKNKLSLLGLSEEEISMISIK